MEAARQLFAALNRDYLAVHKAKEDLFWDTYMAISDDHAGFAKAEDAYKNFTSSPAKLAQVRAALAQLSADDADTQALKHGLTGWLALFESNIIDSDAARDLMSQLIVMEAELFAKKRDYVQTHINDKGERVEATQGSLATNMSTNPSEQARKSSFDAMAGLENWVLENGFLEIVKQRNAFARAQGYANYFDYKVRKNEQMSSEELFAILDDFEVRTRDANLRGLNELVKEHGKDALLPWNFRYTISGDVARQLDPYLPFAKGLQRWVDSFCGLGITYRGATLQLDLLERKGKYQNGFCHGPIPSFVDADGSWVAGQINFTSDAKPDQVGSGARAINTLFHEGGHAAHFANITQNSPCFSQEFAPSSMAYAETQSMFCDSLLEDADWLKRYAKNAAGEAVPDALIKVRIEKTQPFAALNERNILVVPYFERALYLLADDALTSVNALALAREFEMKILGFERAGRPLLAIPHLLNQESAAAYHGYLLANMAVYQTRAFFEREYGYLTDNPAIGPLLSEHYWAPGNSISHNASLISLTGEAFNAKYLADACNQTVEDAWNEASDKISAAASRSYPESPVKHLDAHIRIVHGAELLADNQQSDAQMYQDFERWVAKQYGE
ncbi:M3 family metallopeptidase [Iodobacter sp. CM08]|uniref:M3 family metallopeptidase n=1 Tax=Iodobacter sp. CM08 TaxID=3085902 RepID=UPI00298252F8|nr:M3 family metallopeptidase [Iodobacter sp. CM08]MDW5415964.1 M3 family metallopeptidase [Iodobacter sp. CM08]